MDITLRSAPNADGTATPGAPSSDGVALTEVGATRNDAAQRRCQLTVVSLAIGLLERRRCGVHMSESRAEALPILRGSAFCGLASMVGLHALYFLRQRSRERWSEA